MEPECCENCKVLYKRMIQWCSLMDDVVANKFDMIDYKLEKILFDLEYTKKTSRYVPKSLRTNVFEKFNYRCVQCGATNKDCMLEIDHIIPLNKGGGNGIENLQVLCSSCNRSKNG